MYKNFSKVYDLMMEYSNYEEWEDIVEDKIRVYGNDPETILDLGCGTGEVLMRLAPRYKMTGVDLSEEMVKIAKSKIDTVRFSVQDMRSFRLEEKNDITISLFDTINHLVSIEGLRETFQSVWNNLNKGGLYIFDIVTRELMEEMFQGGNFIDGREEIFIVWEHEYDDELELDYVDTTFFHKEESGLYKKITEKYIKKIFTVEEVIRTAKEVGFKVLEVSENKNLAGERIFFTLEKE